MIKKAAVKAPAKTPAVAPATDIVTAPAASPKAAATNTPAKAAVKKPAASKTSAPAPAPKKTAARKAVAKPAPVEVPREKVRKAKLVRDSFTMPESEYAVLGQVKKACLKAGVDIKKSELLRVGVLLLSQLDMAALQGILSSLPQLKTGRPGKE
jgi:hypothetical protein